MESVDRVAMSLALHPVLARRKAAGAGERELSNVVAASAEGYAFPTNLDRDQPVGGLAPQTQAELLWRALRDGWEPDAFAGALRAHTERRAT
jgi:ectoine hydroxylase-related dioxygenase (phytanoyl-CoA dioxygenase family)